MASRSHAIPMAGSDGTTAFLRSDDAGYMTGATLLVDGGCSLFQYER